MMVHNSLVNYYNLNFTLLNYHKWAPSEVENMLPFERDIYVGLLENALSKEEQK